MCMIDCHVWQHFALAWVWTGRRAGCAASQASMHVLGAFIFGVGLCTVVCCTLLLWVLNLCIGLQWGGGVQEDTVGPLCICKPASRHLCLDVCICPGFCPYMLHCCGGPASSGAGCSSRWYCDIV